MRALLLVLVTSLAIGCGDDTIIPFDPAPLPPEIDEEPDEPEQPPATRPFTMIRDISGAVGYCGAENAMVDGVAFTSVQCQTIGTKANSIVFDNDGRVVHCRVGHVPEVDNLEFVSCPPAVNGSRIELTITPTPGRTDGNYRADVLYDDYDGATKAHSSSFYVHRSLDGASPCPADPATYPTDSRFFAEAIKRFTAPAQDEDLLTRLPSWIDPISRKGSLPHVVTFAQPFVGTPPFYQLHFKNVTLGAYRKVATVSPSTQAVGVRDLGTQNEFDVPIWSLRHRITFNGDRTLVIVRRAFESRMAEKQEIEGLCTMPIRFGATNHRATVNCDALVLNAAGEGFCMTFDQESNTISQTVFSLTMVAKLMRGSTEQGAPRSSDRPMWGPKRFSPVSSTGTFGPDSMFEFGDAVLLRP